MNHEAEQPRLVEALLAAQAEFSVVPKDADNPFFDSKYADLPSIMRMVGPVLTKYGLVLTQHPNMTVTANGDVIDTLTTRIIHTSGEELASTMRLHLAPDKKGNITPQSQGSAITYARRYALSAALGIVTDVDDDGNEASKGVATISPAQQRELVAAAKERGLTPVDAQDALEQAVGVRSTDAVPVDKFDAALSALQMVNVPAAS